MSYILDALRRAEVERQRGTVPALHAVHEGAVTVAAAPAGAHRVWPRAGLAVAALVLLLAGAAGAWLIGRLGAGAVPLTTALTGAAAMNAPTGATAMNTPTGAAAVAAPSGAAAPVPVISASAVDKSVPAAGANLALALAGPPAGLTGVPVRPAKNQPAAPGHPDQPSAALAAEPFSHLAAATAVSGERVPRLAELPEDFRRQLPAIALAGGMYSELATQRLVIFNGSVVREGDQPATDLRVVEIRPRAVVFSFRGRLFVVNL